MRKYHRSIFFTKTPLTKKFKYKDIFQIFPATLEKMPYSSLQNHYPNILEFWTTTDEKIIIENILEDLKEHYSETAVILNKQDKILSILSLLSNHLFFRYEDLTGIWGIPTPEEDSEAEKASWRSKWIWPMYMFDEMPRQLQIDKFTSPDIPTIILLPHITYYTYYPNVDFETKDEIKFPSTVEEILDAYFNLAGDTLKVINSAISYSINAMEIRLYKKTLSLLCSFTSVEAMVNLEYKDFIPEKCENCGQQRFSVAKKFRDYLLKYIGTSEENKRKFNSYYSLRSKIVHTGRQVKSEKLFSEVSQDDRNTDLLTQIEVLQMGKLSIINWLILSIREQ